MDGLGLLPIIYYTHSPDGGTYATIHIKKCRHLANVKRFINCIKYLTPE